MSDFLVVAEQLLRTERRPMGARELTDLGIERALFSDKLHGKTPWQTMKSKLSTEIRTHGEASRFIRTAPGRFFLRDLATVETALYRADPWQPPPSRERVMVFPCAALDALGRFQGVTTTWRKLYGQLFRGDLCRPLDRPAAELTEEHKQILTYIVVTRGHQVLAYRRGTYNRVEQMLKGAECVGFGGHIREDDRSLFSGDDVGVVEGAGRELNEELRLPKQDRLRLASGGGLEIIGLLNDDSSDVGRRHFAVLMRYEASASADWDVPTRGEKSITRLRWVDPGSTNLRLSSFEYWSQLALRALFPRQLHKQATYTIRSRAPFKLPHLLALVGPIGSGKTEAAAVLRESYGYGGVNSGRVLASLMAIPPVPETPRDVFQQRAGAYIQQPSSDVTFATAMLLEADKQETGRILIDGLRQRATLKALKMLNPGRRTAILYVHTPPDVAFRFYREREQPALDIHGFLKLRNSPVETEVASLIEVSDAVLYNWVGVSSYRSAIRKLMGELGIKCQ